MHQKEQRKNNLVQIRLPKGVKKGIVYVGFALAGAVIMLLVKDSGGKRPVNDQKNTEQVSSSTNRATSDTLLAGPVNANTADPKEEEYIPSEENKIVPVKEERSAVESSLPVRKKETAINDEANQEITEKKKSVTEEPVTTKPAPAANLASQLSLKANSYETGSFGGIRNLEMTLQNDSKYLLDKVVVELKYLNPEGVTLKTEDIYFHSVYPGEAETVAVKKTKRGVKVAYKITVIESKETVGSITGL